MTFFFHQSPQGFTDHLLHAAHGKAVAEQVASLTARDKKAGDDGVGYVLLEAIGAPRAGVRVPPALELEVIEWLLAR